MEVVAIIPVIPQVFHLMMIPAETVEFILGVQMAVRFDPKGLDQCYNG